MVKVGKVKSIDLEHFGDYRMGLTSEEIQEYLVNQLSLTRKRQVNTCPKWLINKFNDIAGCNTGAVSPNGKFLMYRHDVKRFSEALFKNKPTYFD